MDKYIDLHSDLFIEKSTRGIVLDNVNMLKVLAFPVLKVNNAVANGEFLDSTGWTAAAGTVSMANKTASLIGDGASAVIQLNSSIFSKAIPSNRKVYVRVSTKPNEAQKRIFFRLAITAVGSSTIDVVTPIALPIGQYTHISNVVTTPIAYDSGIPYFYVQPEYIDAATQNGKTFDVQKVLIIDLTDFFGVGNEPTKEIMDKLLL